MGSFCLAAAFARRQSYLVRMVAMGRQLSRVDSYALGYSAEESRRLQLQATLLEDFLRYALHNAGLREGMRVLDIGCGVGDVSLLAGRIVGPTGSVLGVDRAESSIKSARERAEALGADNTVFYVSDLERFESDDIFDAIIGRFVLLYLRDPAASLRALLKNLRKGGIVAFQELDMSQAHQVPHSELFSTVNNWIFGAFTASGSEIDMGSKLAGTFLRAGAPWPTMISSMVVSAGPDSPYYDFLAEMVQSMLPIIEQAGLATREEIQLDTLADRLRRDAVANERVLYPPLMVSAWATIT